MRVMVIGSTGLLGQYLCKHFSTKHELMELHRTVLKDDDKLKALINNFNPEVVLYSAALADPDLCEIMKEKADLYNWMGVKKVYECLREETKLIFFSTNYVFGKAGEYDENAHPNPINYYGITKYCGELEAMKNEETLIIRLSKLYGLFSIGVNPRFLFDIFLSRDVGVDNVLIRYPLFTEDIPKITDMLLDREGIIHVCNDKGVTKYQWALIAKEIMDTNSKIYPTYEESKAKRPNNVKLVSSESDIRATSLEKGMEAIYGQLS
ncbi:unnamed protein product [marine sediment metagenome]|uniref:RmlD-like substrate binding domain-containing protein n=2 Tax=marine sediment metagenome TaxID=412755 RepID=X1RMD3_9ZZZZ